MKQQVRTGLVILVAGMTALLTTSNAMAGSSKGKNATAWEITVTNTTKGQTFTPLFAATHTRGASLFKLGSPASDALAELAESGSTAGVTAEFEGRGSAAGEILTSGGLLGPGETRVFTIKGSYRARYLTMAAMLIPTNDTFFALQSVRLPKKGSRTFTSPGYDAGSEENDQNCLNIPGPRCGGQGPSLEAAEGDEGYVHIGNGFHDLGFEDEAGNEILGPFTYDWRNAVVTISARRVKLRR